MGQNHTIQFLVCVCNKTWYLNLLGLFETKKLKIEKQFIV